MKIECSKMRSESSEFTWRAKAILIHLESYLEERAQEVWERIRMNLDMHITWWYVKTQKPMEMILMVRRKQSEEACDLDTRNLARMGTNFERARRMQGMTTGHIDMVLIATQIRANGDWS